MSTVFTTRESASAAPGVRCNSEMICSESSSFYIIAKPLRCDIRSICCNTRSICCNTRSRTSRARSSGCDSLSSRINARTVGIKTARIRPGSGSSRSKTSPSASGGGSSGSGWRSSTSGGSRLASSTASVCCEIRPSHSGARVIRSSARSRGWKLRAAVPRCEATPRKPRDHLNLSRVEKNRAAQSPALRTRFGSSIASSLNACLPLS